MMSGCAVLDAHFLAAVFAEGLSQISLFLRHIPVWLPQRDKNYTDIQFCKIVSVYCIYKAIAYIHQ